MKAKPITRSERRRMEAIKAQHERELNTQYHNAFSKGQADGEERGKARAMATIASEKEAARASGAKEGAAEVRQAVLDHAGRLYKERKDADATAVREVHRLLVESAK